LLSSSLLLLPYSTSHNSLDPLLSLLFLLLKKNLFFYSFDLFFSTLLLLCSALRKKMGVLPLLTELNKEGYTRATRGREGGGNRGEGRVEEM
jgi:hypothetical protein